MDCGGTQRQPYNILKALRSQSNIDSILVRQMMTTNFR